MKTILNIFHKITYFHNLVYIYKDGSLEDGDQDLEDDNYLDPERDYDLINNLRRFIMTNNSEHESTDEICVEDAHFKTMSN